MRPVWRTSGLLFLALLLAFSRPSLAQENPATLLAPPPAQSQAPQPHKFWDAENIYLFTGVGAVRALDYASTRHLRDQGDYEVLLSNSIVDNRPLFVGIEVAGTAASIGVSYLLHRTGHHRLERWVSLAHIGAGVGGSIHNYLLKPIPPTAQPGITIQHGR